ncbi:MAG: hypothetical protein HZC55_12495 [Verrucomicrobia bacterium]|nr:hypothetical protein [Verrucomicrobiota bacterium]
MKPLQPCRIVASCLAAGVPILLLAGCVSIFVPKHRVLVDAIAAPGYVAKPSGTSYRLVAKESTVAGQQAQVGVIKACVDAALAGKGMFEAPDKVAPDIVIEVGFGVDVTPRVDASARETFLQLSARSNPGKSLDRGTGPEIWDVRVSVLGVSGRMETAMPLLSAVAVDYMGMDTKLETRIEIPQNSPAIGAVRESAIKSLETRLPPSSAAPAGAPSPAAAANAAVTPVTTK